MTPFADLELTTISIGIQVISSVIKIGGEGFNVINLCNVLSTSEYDFINLSLGPIFLNIELHRFKNHDV